jgi:hypothetical protein
MSLKTLQFDPKIGLVVSNEKSLVVLTDLDALVNKVEQRLQFFLEEWFLDTSAGVPYLQQIFTKPVDAGLIVNLISGEISKEKDVTQVQNAQIEFDKENRKFIYSANITTVYGNAVVTTGESV